MAVKIRLLRMGKIRNPQYRIVIADAKTRRNGRSIEEIGIYQPKLEPSLIRVDSERAQYWLSVGAQPTEAVMAILKVTGDWQKYKGLPGAEGTLRVAEVKPDKKTLFAAAVLQAAADKEEEGRAPKPMKVQETKKAEAVAAEVVEEASAAVEAPAADVVEEAPAAEAAEVTEA